MKKIGTILTTLLVSGFLTLPLGTYAMEPEDAAAAIELNAVETAADDIQNETAVVETSYEDTTGAVVIEKEIETESELETETETESKDETEVESESKPETETEIESKDETKVESESKSETETEIESEKKDEKKLEDDTDENGLFDATYAELNQTAVFLKQETSYTCTLSSATMMLRRAALLDGKNWQSITESAVRSVAWPGGLSWSFSYAGYNVYGGTYIGSHSVSERWNTLRDLLAAHPEGIVAYNGNDEHAVLLTDYVNGTFYCADPANDPSVGRIPLRDAYKITGPSSITRIWYILSPSVTPPTNVTPSNNNTPTPAVPDPEPTPDPVNEEKVSGFVTRLYQNVLTRNPDANGLKYWVDKMTSRTMNGSEVADAFVNSKELTNRNLSNSDYIDMLYRSFMDRNPEANGKSYWTNILETGMSRYYVFSEFSNSKEFAGICADYGIDQGEVLPTEARDLNIGVTGFVSRLYTKALGRNYDVKGLNDWCTKINFAQEMRTTAINVAMQFFASNEFTRSKNNQDDSAYIQVLYRTFLNREADSTGLSYWLTQMGKGKTKEDVLKGFAVSNEFNKIMDKYNIN